jgi:hypothetical protein
MERGSVSSSRIDGTSVIRIDGGHGSLRAPVWATTSIISAETGW